MASKTVTPELMAQVAQGLAPFTCDLIHSGHCVPYWVKMFLKAFKLAFKFYLPLHFIPVLIRYKALLSKPLSVIKGASKACIRSTMLLTLMVIISKVTLCIYLKFIPKMSVKLILIVASICVNATFIESPARVSEMALYVMPRFLEAGWKFLKRRGIVMAIPNASVLLFSASMAALVYCNKYEPEHVKPTYRNISNKFFGEN